MPTNTPISNKEQLTNEEKDYNNMWKDERQEYNPSNMWKDEEDYEGGKTRRKRYRNKKRKVTRKGKGKGKRKRTRGYKKIRRTRTSKK